MTTLNMCKKWWYSTGTILFMGHYSKNHFIYLSWEVICLQIGINVMLVYGMIFPPWSCTKSHMLIGPFIRLIYFYAYIHCFIAILSDKPTADLHSVGVKFCSLSIAMQFDRTPLNHSWIEKDHCWLDIMDGDTDSTQQ